MPHKKRKINISRGWPFRLCFLSWTFCVTGFVKRHEMGPGDPCRYLADLLSSQKSSPSWGQRGRWASVSPTSHHVMEQRGELTHHVPSLPQVLHGGDPCLTELRPDPWISAHKRNREGGGTNL